MRWSLMIVYAVGRLLIKSQSMFVDVCWIALNNRKSKNLPLQGKIGRRGRYNVSLRSTKRACLEVHRLSRVLCRSA